MTFNFTCTLQADVIFHKKLRFLNKFLYHLITIKSFISLYVCPFPFFSKKLVFPFMLVCE